MSSATTALPPSTPPPPQQQQPAMSSSSSASSSSAAGCETPKKRALEDSAPDAAMPPPPTPATGGPPAKKKTKMTEAEKEAEKRKAVEAKEAEKRKKEEEKRAKEEEKRKEKEAKEEERKAREREREAKKAEREEKKRLKDEEKRKKEEALAKKARAQPKLDMFFRTPAKDQQSSPGPESSKNSSSPTTTKKPPLPANHRDTYHGYFQTFFVKKNMVVAPTHAFQRDEEAKLAVRRAIDEKLGLPRKDTENAMDTDDDGEVAPVRGVTKEEIEELLHIAPHKARSKRGRVLTYSTKDVLARIENPDDPGLPPLDTGRAKPTAGKYDAAFYLKLLNELPYKYLKFAEDVRPPYCGTYAKNPISSGLRKGRKPFEKALPGVDYDYDSEAEWVADEEGEELLSEDEDDKESETGDSLDGFLDDEEEDVGRSKRGGASVLIPTNSGMCWEDATTGKNARPDFEDMRIEILLDHVSGPIDPFSTKYWEPQPAAASADRVVTAMEPPRKPLTATNRVLPTSLAVGTAPGKKLVPPEYMEDFKRAIDGSDMTKAGLIEQLKKAFPKVGKDNIKNTLELVAERVGEKRDDKRWVLK